MNDDLTSGGAASGEGSGDQGVGKSPEALLEHISAEVADNAMFPGSLRENYFFAYDILLDQSTIGRFIKALLPAKIVKVPHYRLAWPWFYPPVNSALPTLERTNRDEDAVWGILYDGRGKDFRSLERFLKVPNRYHRLQIQTIDRGDRRITAFTYVLNPRDCPASKPSMEFIEQLVGLARERSLPEEWIDYLNSIECGEQE